MLYTCPECKLTGAYPNGIIPPTCHRCEYKIIMKPYMVKETPIYCPNPKCGKKVTTQENLMHYVIPYEGYKCPYCRTVVVRSSVGIY